MGDPVIFPVETAEVPAGLEDIVLADGIGDILLVPEKSLLIKRCAGDRLSMAGIRGRARRQGRRQLGLQIAPGQPLLFDRDIRVRLFVLIDDRLKRRDRLWL